MAKHTKEEAELLQQLGNRIRELRKAKGFESHEAFAYKYNIARSQYGRYEKGVDIRLTTLSKVLKALDVSLAEFFSEGFDQ